MSKIITWVVVVGIVAVGGYFWLGSGNQSAEISMEQEGAATEEEVMLEESSKKMAFSEFIKAGGSYKCTVNQSAEGVTSGGTVYIDGAMVRGEFNSVANSLNVDTSLIVRDGFTYSWSSLTPTLGFKVKAEAPKEEDTTAETKASYAWNSETIGDYDCEPWTADASMFAVPTTITFQELGAQ